MPIETDPISDRFNIASGSLDSVPIKMDDTGSIDAFARLRVANPTTLFDSKQVFNDTAIAASLEQYPLFWDNQETSGASTSTTFNHNRASTKLSVATGTAGTRVRQTKQRFNYQPGKSQLVILTGLAASAGSTASGITKRLGYFDDNNGLFYEDAGGAWSVNVRDNTSGCVTTTSVCQPDWSLDPMDGSGDSGVALSPSSVHILFLDFEWLGVGRRRFGFFIDGIPIYCHEFNTANSASCVWASNPNLPIRFEISNDGSGDADSVEQICSTVISEGGFQELGSIRSPNPKDVITHIINANTAGSTYVVAGMKLKDGYLNQQVDLINVSLIGTTVNDDYAWGVYLNPTMSASLTYNDIPNSGIQYAFGSTAAEGDTITSTSSVVIAGGLVKGETSITARVISVLRLGSTIAGSSDEFVLGVTPRTANLDIAGMMEWEEGW